MSAVQGKIRISKSQSMNSALTLPYAMDISIDSNDWNASADRGVDKIRIDFLGYVYTLKFTLPPQVGPEIFKSIQDITRDLEFYVEFFNPEYGKRVVMKCYRSATSYKLVGYGRDIWESTPYEWIGVSTVR